MSTERSGPLYCEQLARALTIYLIFTDVVNGTAENQHKEGLHC